MTHTRPSGGFRGPRNVRGLSLIELMLSLLLGLIVVGAAGGVFLANKRVYAASETLNRVQENGRVAFELMARDVREAGGSPCGNDSQIVNLLKLNTGTWWDMFGDGLRGYDGGSLAGTGTVPVPNAVAGTDAVDLFGGALAGGDITITNQDTPSAEVGLSSTAGLADGDIAIACNTKFTLVFQITGVQSSSLKVGHQGGNGGNAAPGNCGQNFQHVSPGTNCSGASGGNTYCFTKPNSGSGSSGTAAACDKYDDMPAVLTKVGGVRWYVGTNPRGSRSLYRASFNAAATGAAPTVSGVEEIAEGISDMQLEYRVLGGTSFVPASGITNWKQVNAARIRVISEGVSGALTGSYVQGTDGKALSRQFNHVVAMRNREGVL